MTAADRESADGVQRPGQAPSFPRPADRNPEPVEVTRAVLGTHFRGMSAEQIAALTPAERAVLNIAAFCGADGGIEVPARRQNG